jgi:hypothetical protein
VIGKRAQEGFRGNRRPLSGWCGGHFVSSLVAFAQR